MTKVTYKAFLGKGNRLTELNNLDEVEALVLKNVFLKNGYEVMVSAQYTNTDDSDDSKEDVDPAETGGVEIDVE
jgi:hypothetical protein